MKAIVRARYGSPDVLELQEVEKPVPKVGEVLVRVHAASVNTLDWHLMRGQPALSRLALGFPHPKAPILGADRNSQRSRRRRPRLSSIRCRSTR